MPEAADSNPRENMISKVVEQEKLVEEKLVIIRRKEAKDSQECSNFESWFLPRDPETANGSNRGQEVPRTFF